MPYAFDYTPTYKSPIRDYWVAQINGTSFTNKTTMIIQLDTLLNDITTAETNYKTRNNDLSQNYLRYRWQAKFGFFNLYVLYMHCMVLPSNLPAPIGMMIPWPAGNLLTNDDLRGFCTAWRYTWPGNGTTNTPWFTLTDNGDTTGTVTEINYGIGVGEATAMKTAFNNHYPTYSGRYTNSTSYPLGIDSGGGNYTLISDFNPNCGDQDRFWTSTNSNYGVIDRISEFINAYNWTTHNYKRFRDGRTILNHLAAGGSVFILTKPKDWMLEHGGQELMDYFGWTDIAGNIL